MYFFLFIYLFILFIYGLFYDAVSVTDYVISYGWMYGEWWTGKTVEGIGYCVIEICL